MTYRVVIAVVDDHDKILFSRAIKDKPKVETIQDASHILRSVALEIVQMRKDWLKDLREQTLREK